MFNRVFCHACMWLLLSAVVSLFVENRTLKIVHLWKINPYVSYPSCLKLLIDYKERWMQFTKDGLVSWVRCGRDSACRLKSMKFSIMTSPNTRTLWFFKRKHSLLGWRICCFLLTDTGQLMCRKFWAFVTEILTVTRHIYLQ